MADRAQKYQHDSTTRWWRLAENMHYELIVRADASCWCSSDSVVLCDEGGVAKFLQLPVIDAIGQLPFLLIKLG